MAFTLPSLPYSNDALEPHIDTKTMEILHQKLLMARSKDQEDRIVNLMVAELKLNHLNKIEKSKSKSKNLKI